VERIISHVRDGRAEWLAGPANNFPQIVVLIYFSWLNKKVSKFAAFEPFEPFAAISQT
jgi:hypothetical protein